MEGKSWYGQVEPRSQTLDNDFDAIQAKTEKEKKSVKVQGKSFLLAFTYYLVSHKKKHISPCQCLICLCDVSRTHPLHTTHNKNSVGVVFQRKKPVRRSKRKQWSDTFLVQVLFFKLSDHYQTVNSEERTAVQKGIF